MSKGRFPPVSKGRFPPVSRGRARWEGRERLDGDRGAKGREARRKGRPRRRRSSVSVGGEGLVPLGGRRPVEVFLVDENARRGDDALANEHIISSFRIARAPEEGADPAARAEAGFMMVRRRLENDGARTEGGKVHDAGWPAGEALMRRDVGVGRRGAGRRDQGIMPFDGVVDQPWPEADRRVGGVLDGNGHFGDHADDALGDRVQVVVMGRARGVVDERGRAERAERV